MAKLFIPGINRHFLDYFIAELIKITMQRFQSVHSKDTIEVLFCSLLNLSNNRLTKVSSFIIPRSVTDAISDYNSIRLLGSLSRKLSYGIDNFESNRSTEWITDLSAPLGYYFVKMSEFDALATEISQELLRRCLPQVWNTLPK